MIGILKGRWQPANCLRKARLTELPVYPRPSCSETPPPYHRIATGQSSRAKAQLLASAPHRSRYEFSTFHIHISDDNCSMLCHHSKINSRSLFSQYENQTPVTTYISRKPSPSILIILRSPGGTVRRLGSQIWVSYRGQPQQG